MIRRLLSLHCLAVALFISQPEFAYGQNHPILDAAGFQQNRDYFSPMPFEHIDMVSGGLTLTFTDLVLPGNAGRELRFERSYNSKNGQWRFGIAGIPLRLGTVSYRPKSLPRLRKKIVD